MPDIELTTVAVETTVDINNDHFWMDDVSEAGGLNRVTALSVRTAMFATGAIDGGALTSFEIPNSATPTLAVDGQIAVDTTVTDFSYGLLKYFSGEECTAVAMPTGNFTSPSDGDVVTYDGTNDEFRLVAPASGTPAATTDVLTGTDTTKFVTSDALAALWEQGSDITSAGTISVGEGGYFFVTGTTTITDIDFATDKTGRKVWLKFNGILTLTHHSTTLILPTGANITTAAGDVACFVSEGSDNVRCISYTRASGASLVGGLTIGNAVSGGGANRVLYEDGSQNLATSANFTFNGDTLAVTGTTGGTTALIVTANGSNSNGIYVGGVGTNLSTYSDNTGFTIFNRGYTSIEGFSQLVFNTYPSASYLTIDLRDATNNILNLLAGVATNVPLRIKLASAHSANALEINSNSGSSGDIFKVSAAGLVTLPTAGGILHAEVITIKTQADSPYTVLNTDSNTRFTNEGTTALVTFNLPTAVAGLTYVFYVADTDGIRVVANAGDDIRINTTVSATAGRIDSTAIGSCVKLTAINATNWIAEYTIGTWAVT
jgi:hypothetical protein